MAHFAMGVLRRVQNRLSDSRVELETAVALDRNNARTLQQLGLTLMWLAQPESAIPQIEKAIRLNPYDPNIASYYWALGSSHLVSGRIDDAASLLEKARAEYPWYGNAQFVALAEPTLYAGLRRAGFPEE